MTAVMMLKFLVEVFKQVHMCNEYTHRALCE